MLVRAWGGGSRVATRFQVEGGDFDLRISGKQPVD